MNQEKDHSSDEETQQVNPELSSNNASASTSSPSPAIISGSKTKPVILYIVIMFAVALFLIILSFLMQQRNHNALMKGLSSSTISTQTIVDLELETKELEKKLTQTTEQLNTMTTDNKNLQETTASLERKSQALEWLMEIRQNYTNGKHSKAKELLKKMQENGLVDALPAESALPDNPSPRAIYEEILLQLS